MTGQRQPAFSRRDALVAVALVGLVLAVTIPLVLHFRLESKRKQSERNLARLVLAARDYSDRQPRDGTLPPGCDNNNFSVVAKILPYLGEPDLYKQIDFSKSITDPANGTIRRTRLAVVLSPLDDQPLVARDPTKAPAPTSYLFNGFAFRTEKFPTRIPVSFLNGTSNTVFVVETLRGDGETRAVAVRRQHIVLSEREARKYEKDNRGEIGVAEFRASTHVAADRCSSWMDGRMLQGTFISGRHSYDDRIHPGQRSPNDHRPDVVVEIPDQLDGLAAPRSLSDIVLVGMGDGSARRIDTSKLPPDRWIKATDPDWLDWGAEW